MPHDEPLPGEAHPIPIEAGRAITDEEALGVARRLARLLTRRNKKPSAMAETATWPDEAALTMAAWRIPTAALMRARARAEAEGITISEVARTLLDGYGRAPMGSVAAWHSPDEVLVQEFQPPHV